MDQKEKKIALLKEFLKLIDWILYQLLANSFFYKAAKNIKHDGFFSKPPPASSKHHYVQYQDLSKFVFEQEDSTTKFDTLVCDIDGSILTTQSFFPYFMLVAFEGGSIIRAFFLLLSCPILFLLNYEFQLKTMIFITFCGLKLKNMKRVESAVLPKFYLENLNYQVYQMLNSSASKFVFTSVPKVMVEGFLKEYLNVDEVTGTELQTYADYYTGFVDRSGVTVKNTALVECFGDKKPDVGIGCCSSNHGQEDDHIFLSLCKTAYVVNNHDTKSNMCSKMPREKYPKPLIFHDGRLAFLPTPFSTLSMFLWLPFGLLVAIFRIFIGIYLPYKAAASLNSFSGFILNVNGVDNFKKTKVRTSEKSQKNALYVCTHRTLLDPIFLSGSLGKPLTAVTYSLSKFSEIVSPLKTARLTRDRKVDGETMEKLLKEDDLVVCPEGTTCREPYLLRFSSLFAEVTDEIIPVAMNTKVSMFYGTTTSGAKWLDPIFFLLNPRPCYFVHVLEKVGKENTCGGGGKSSKEVANMIQNRLGDILGFECTSFTRKDKYMLLAGNEGLVGASSRR